VTAGGQHSYVGSLPSVDPGLPPVGGSRPGVGSAPGAALNLLRALISGAPDEENAMKPALRTLAAIAVGSMILISAAAEAGPRSGITPDEAKRLRYQAQQYQQMKRYAGADGLITRAEQARLNHKAATLRRLIQKAKSN
jgi:hypothetical protein